MHNAEIFKPPTTSPALKMQILHYNANDKCTYTEDFIINSVPESNIPSCSSNLASVAANDVTKEEVKVDEDNTPSCSSNVANVAGNVNEDAETDTVSRVDDDTQKENTYEWEWLPLNSNNMKTESSHIKFVCAERCIDDALRNKPEEQAAVLKLHINYGDRRIKSETMKEDTGSFGVLLIDDAPKKTSYEWEWVPLGSSNTESETSLIKFATLQRCIDSALRNKPEEQALVLKLHMYYGDMRVKTETLKEDDVRLKKLRNVYMKDVTMLTGCPAKKNGNVKLLALYFQGHPRMDIRRWILLGDGQQIPTKKGVALAPQRWARLLNERERVNELLTRIKEGKEQTFPLR